ncbi:MAG: hypothetical protein DSY80_06265 [Desulfocapsa sp.]|nr:MAG: hypothetical protein DSY80_06265 [Desulfocapsa sp.]
MTITVGTDTYATIAEADAFITAHFVSMDAQLIAWNLLSDADKEVYLRNATIGLERLRFSGAKYDNDQSLFFPRVVYNPLPNRRHGDYYTADQTELTYRPEDTPTVPDEIKNAQICEALETASPSSDTDDFVNFIGALKAERVGNVSVTYGKTSGGNRGQVASVIKSRKAQDYLLPFVGGGYRTI